MSHSHKPKVLDWKLNEEMDWVASLFGCLDCDETFVDLPLEEESLGHQHTTYVDGCFGCKIRTLELSTGDTNGNKPMSNAAWDSENQFYADAVKQGVNPSGVFRHEVEASLEASEKLGYAYDADTMVDPQHLTSGAIELTKALADE